MTRFSRIFDLCKARKNLVIAAGAVLLLVTAGGLTAWHFLVEPETVVVRRTKAPRVTLEKAQELYDSGRYEEAFDFCVKHRRHYKDDPQFWNFYGVTQRTLAFLDMTSDAREEELAAFEKAISLAPGFVAARLNLANTLWDAGRHEEAVAQYKKVLRLAPDHADEAGILDRLAEEQRLHREAEKRPRPAPKENPAPMEPAPPSPEPQPSEMNPR
jgi:tetratricopeptide (TPR) repeat protein